MTIGVLLQYLPLLNRRNASFGGSAGFLLLDAFPAGICVTNSATRHVFVVYNWKSTI